MFRTRFTKSNIKYFVLAETSRNTYQVSIFSLGKTLLVNTNLYHLKTILSSLLRYGLYLRRSYCICPIQNTVFGMFNIWNEYVRIMPCYNFFLKFTVWQREHVHTIMSCANFEFTGWRPPWPVNSKFTK